jgi:hypothetical protein
MLICWLLNFVELGIAFLLLASSEKLLPVVYVMAGAIGLVQIAYVVPICRLLLRKGRRDPAAGVIVAACITAIVNLACDYRAFGPALLPFRQ